MNCLAFSNFLPRDLLENQLFLKDILVFKNVLFPQASMLTLRCDKFVTIQKNSKILS